MILVLFSMFALVSAMDSLLTELCMRTPHIRSLATDWCSETVGQCKWKGVSCFENRVVVVRLDNIPIELTLPFTGLANSNVEQLYLSGCGIRGQLESIVQNGRLKLLDLSNNEVTGFVNSNLLHSSVALRLSNVNINGTVSQVLCNGESSGLQELDISHNNIVDDFSDCFGALLPQLRTLKLQGNHIGGRAPFQKGLNVYNISGNSFTSIETNVQPEFISVIDIRGKDRSQRMQIPALSSCDMSKNLFTGAMPDWLSEGKNLNKLAKCKYENTREI